MKQLYSSSLKCIITSCMLAIAMFCNAQFSGVVIQNVNCSGQCTGIAAVSGPLGNNRFQWDGDEYTDTMGYLCAGQHYCVVSNNTGTIVLDTVYVLITEPSYLQASTTTTSPRCANECNAVITVSPFGGTPPYNCTWVNMGALFDSLSPFSYSACPGYSYSFTVTDNNGCTAQSGQVTVENIPELSINVDANNVANCTDSTGFAYCNVNGGTQPYHYLWSTGATDTLYEDFHTHAGWVTVTATDNNGCSIAYSVNVIALHTFGMGISETVNCYNINLFQDTFPATVVINNGTAPPYTIVWGNTGDTTFTENLWPSANPFTVTDGYGCVWDSAAYLTSDGITFSIATTAPSTCQGNDGTATISVAGATGNVYYEWFDFETTATVNDVPSGTWDVTVSDDGGCVIDTSVNIPSFTINIQDSVVTRNISCTNPTGQATIYIFNDTPPFTYNWGDGTNDTTGNTPITHNYYNAGNYEIMITDYAGCSIFYNVNIYDSSFRVELLNLTNPTCINPDSGKLRVTGVLGVPPYTYAWNNGGTDSALMDLSTGNYSVTVTDQSGCRAANIFSLASLTPDFSYYVYTNALLTSCNGNSGSATATVNGTKPPFEYVWSTVPQQTTSIATGLSAGQYTVTITDSLGCVATGSVTINSPCENIISGNLFYDTNGNCMIDSGEMPVTMATLIANGTVASYFATPDSLGYYAFHVPGLGPYTIQMSGSSTGQCSNVVPCSDTSVTVMFDSMGSVSANHNFGFVQSTGFDLDLHLSWSSANPGFEKDYWINYFNLSPTQFTGNVTVTFVYDPALVFLSSDVPYTTFNAVTHTLVWVGQFTGYIGRIHFMVPDTLSVNYLLQSTFRIDPFAGDCDTSNNYYHFTQIVTGSHDPNEKTVTPQGQLTDADSVLTYTINFQNTGTDTAWFITVVDTLCPGLNPASVVNLASSIKYKSFSISGTGILTWVFNPALLPDSIVNAQGSKGFVMFSIKRYTNIADGTPISNKAAIYFDYNPPVVTNIITDTVFAPTPVCVTTYDTITRTICQGDTFYVGNSAFTIAGNFNDTLVNAGGCDSVVTLNLTIDSLVASMININGDTFCSQGSAVVLSCQPSGGTFMGTGVSGNQFNPANANTGADTVYYTYTDSNQCSAISKGYVTVALFPQNIIVDTIIDTVGVTTFFTVPATNGNCTWEQENIEGGVESIMASGDTVTVYCVIYGVRPLRIDTLYGEPYGLRAIINFYGCVDTTAWSVAPQCLGIGGGINQITDDNSIALYPNPATDQLFIKTEGINPQTLSIYDVDGRLISTQAYKPEIDINRLSSGVYFIEVSSVEGVARKRFVKM